MFNTATGASTTLAVGAGPTNAATSSDGRYAYVANSNAGTVSVIAMADLQVERRLTPIDVCAAPGAIGMTPDGQRALITCAFEPRVDVLDPTTTPPKPRTIQVASPGGVVVSPDGHRAYISSSLSDTVTPIDLDSSTPTRRRAGSTSR